MFRKTKYREQNSKIVDPSYQRMVQIFIKSCKYKIAFQDSLKWFYGMTPTNSITTNQSNSQKSRFPTEFLYANILCPE
jgi:hypothetical protein